jgi:hypothetical protein
MNERKGKLNEVASNKKPPNFSSCLAIYFESFISVPKKNAFDTQL